MYKKENETDEADQETKEEETVEEGTRTTNRARQTRREEVKGVGRGEG